MDGNIAIVQNSLSFYPRSHPIRIISVHMLAIARLTRYKLSEEKQELDKSILHYTEAIFLPPVYRGGRSLNAVQLLFHLASALLARSKDFEQPNDSKNSIEYLRYLRGLPLDSFGLTRNAITTSLIRALAIEVEFEAGDGTRNIKEMVVLCRELLASEISADDFTAAFLSLNNAVDTEADRGRFAQLDEATECLRDAVKMCPPGSHLVLLALANTLCTRFMESHSNDDYEEATTLLERILDHNQPGECPDSIRDQASSLATLLAFVRSTTIQKPEYAEVTISHLRTLRNSASIGERLRFGITDVLANQARERFQKYSLAESLEEANSYTSQAVNLSSSQNLEDLGEFFPESDAVRESYSMTRMAEKIQHLEQLRSKAPPGTSTHRNLLSALSMWYETKFCRTNDISDIEQSINYIRLSLNCSSNQQGANRSPGLFHLHKVLFFAFKQTNKISYLDESITVGYNILELERAHNFRFCTTQMLVSSLLTREQLFGRREERHEAIRLMSMVIDDQYKV